jgi:hypothetical protein
LGAITGLDAWVVLCSTTMRSHCMV